MNFRLRIFLGYFFTECPIRKQHIGVAANASYAGPRIFALVEIDAMSPVVTQDLPPVVEVDGIASTGLQDDGDCIIIIVRKEVGGYHEGLGALLPSHPRQSVGILRVTVWDIAEFHVSDLPDLL